MNILVEFYYCLIEIILKMLFIGHYGSIIIMKIMNIFTNTVILDLWFEVYCIILKIEKSFVMSRKRKGT